MSREQAHREALEALARIRERSEARLEVWDAVDTDSARLGRALMRKYLEVAELCATVGPDAEVHSLVARGLHHVYDVLSEVDDVLKLLDPTQLDGDE